MGSPSYDHRVSQTPVADGDTSRDWLRGPPLPATSPLAPSRFEYQARARGPAIAVRTDNGDCSYHDLNRRANRLARWLEGCGAERNLCVAIAIPPSMDFVVALLAVAKVGAAAVPVDPNAPVDRVARVLDQSAASLVITTGDAEQKLPSTTTFVVHLDRDASMIEREPADDVVGTPTPEQLAYVVFTSGTTAMPRGVECTHANLAASLCARDLFYGSPVDRMLAVLSFAFDAGLATIWWTLATGGTLVLPDSKSAADPGVWARTIANEQVTHLMCVPAMLDAVLAQPESWSTSTLTTVCLGGEVCPPELVNLAHSKIPNLTLVNEYGPTEASVWATAHRCERGSSSPIPIGRPVAGTSVYIVGRDARKVTAGEVGELCIAGPLVAHGYRGDHAQTASRFMDDPWSPGQRMYRTGDVARILEDGTLEFRGRLDRQVKLHGHRIELEEVEAWIRLIPDVLDCAVELEPGATGAQMVAHVACPAGRHTSQSLRELLAQNMPPAMVPTRYILAPRLPRTAAGKLDRQALRVVDAQEPQTVDAPTTPIETELVALWAQMLGRSSVGIHSDFFELGGHSLLGASMMTRLAQPPFDVRLPLGALFDAPTIARLGERIEQAQKDQLVDVGHRSDAELESLIDAMPEHEVEQMLATLSGEANDG